MTTTLGHANATTTRHRWPVWAVSAIAALAAAVVTELYGLAARAAGIPMSIAGVGASKATPITVGDFAVGVVTCCFWGTVLAILLARLACRPARTWLVTTLTLTAVSMAAPALASDTAVSTKIMLVVAHLIAAAIVVPVVARRLTAVPADRRPDACGPGAGVDPERGRSRRRGSAATRLPGGGRGGRY